jgi:hypothetical protein
MIGDQMSVHRWPATLHQGAASQQIEISLDAAAFTLHAAGGKQKWPFAETQYRSGGVPRFERADAVLIVPDHKIAEAIGNINPQALNAMEHTSGMFTAGDFLTGLIAVAIVMAGAAILAGAIWYFRK